MLNKNPLYRGDFYFSGSVFLFQKRKDPGQRVCAIRGPSARGSARSADQGGCLRLRSVPVGSSTQVEEHPDPHVGVLSSRSSCGTSDRLSREGTLPLASRKVCDSDSGVVGACPQIDESEIALVVEGNRDCGQARHVHKLLLPRHRVAAEPGEDDVLLDVALCVLVVAPSSADGTVGDEDLPRSAGSIELPELLSPTPLGDDLRGRPSRVRPLGDGGHPPKPTRDYLLGRGTQPGLFGEAHGLRHSGLGPEDVGVAQVDGGFGEGSPGNRDLVRRRSCAELRLVHPSVRPGVDPQRPVRCHASGGGVDEPEFIDLEFGQGQNFGLARDVAGFGRGPEGAPRLGGRRLRVVLSDLPLGQVLSLRDPNLLRLFGEGIRGDDGGGRDERAQNPQDHDDPELERAHFCAPSPGVAGFWGFERTGWNFLGSSS